MAKKSSSKQKQIKKATKKAMKAAKKNPKGAAIFVLVLILLIGIGIGGYFAYRTFINPDYHLHLNGSEAYSIGLNSEYKEKGAVATYNGKDISDQIEISYAKGEAKTPVNAITTEAIETFYVTYSVNYEKMSEQKTRIVSITEFDPISITFLELGNKYTGDCTYIRAGETDILIDAGSRNDSAATITNYVNQYCTDNTLEYVIATHAHQDHIAGFVGTKDKPGIFDAFKVDTLIQFPLTKATSAVYNNYCTKRDTALSEGRMQHSYTAQECIEESNGAKRIYEVANGITMEVLDSKYYRDSSNNDENEFSVCVLFTQGENHYLFTGDLEAHGEAALVELNDLPKVQLFKGGHHGSYTANTDALLSVIQPEVVCICCCCGSTEYTSDMANVFPAQAAIDRIAKYTDCVYVTTLVEDYSSGVFVSMNGNITCYSADGNTMTVNGSNNNTKFKDTTWFKTNRTCPSEWTI